MTRAIPGGGALVLCRWRARPRSLSFVCWMLVVLLVVRLLVVRRALVVCCWFGGHSSSVGGPQRFPCLLVAHRFCWERAGLAARAPALLGAHRVCWWRAGFAGGAPTLVIRLAFNACSVLGGALERLYTVILWRVRGASGIGTARGVSSENAGTASEPYGAASWPCLVDVGLQARLTRSDKAPRFAHGTRSRSDS